MREIIYCIICQKLHSRSFETRKKKTDVVVAYSNADRGHEDPSKMSNRRSLKLSTDLTGWISKKQLFPAQKMKELEYDELLFGRRKTWLLEIFAPITKSVSGQNCVEDD